MQSLQRSIHKGLAGKKMTFFSGKIGRNLHHWARRHCHWQLDYPFLFMNKDHNGQIIYGGTSVNFGPYYKPSMKPQPYTSPFITQQASYDKWHQVQSLVHPTFVLPMTGLPRKTLMSHICMFSRILHQLIPGTYTPLQGLLGWVRVVDCRASRC